MSTQSKLELAAIKAGCQLQSQFAEWQGSIADCWATYVEAKQGDGRFPCEVYWVSLTVAGERFFKIGISENTKKRRKIYENNLPIGVWKIERLARVPSKRIAERCETDMIVACRSLHIAGEWLADPEYAEPLGPDGHPERDPVADQMNHITNIQHPWQ